MKIKYKPKYATNSKWQIQKIPYGRFLEFNKRTEFKA